MVQNVPAKAGLGLAFWCSNPDRLDVMSSVLAVAGLLHQDIKPRPAFADTCMVPGWWLCLSCDHARHEEASSIVPKSHHTNYIGL